MSLRTLLASEEFSALDRQLADFIQQRGNGATFPALAAAAVSRALRQGHVCLAIDQWPELARDLQWPREFQVAADLRRELDDSPLVGGSGEFCPLIVWEDRLYLQRYWQYEQTLARRLKELAAAGVEGFDAKKAGQILDRLFPPEQATPWQKVAVFTGLHQSLTILTGGPGTGKTFTLVLLLAAIQQLQDQRLRIALCAPTGKAAGRLQESIARLRATHPALAQADLPVETSTIHRLLGSRGDSIHFRHHRDNPLPVDVVVVDEASMIDLALFTKLVEALPPGTRLILAGDQNQLASVEAGSIFADLLEGVAPNLFSAAFHARWKKAGGGTLPDSGPSLEPARRHLLQDAVVELEKNFRFDEKSQIAKAGHSLRRGHALPPAMLEFRSGDLRFESVPTLGQLKEKLRPLVLSQFDHVLKAPDPSAALGAMGGFGLLCALRHGPWGARAVNQIVQSILAEEGRIQRGESSYAGKPVLITRNDYHLKLFNGEIGLTLVAPGKEPLVYFADPMEGIRAFTPARLPGHETAHALTIHKSQGSEWEEVAVVLPPEGSPILSRELIYTALTRARRQVRLFSLPSILSEAWTRRTRRHSGLPGLLLADPASTAMTSRR